MAKSTKKTSSVPRINIGISDKDRAAVAGELSKLLADSYTLYLMTHNFHWNVTGPMFNTLHQMFMTQYTEEWTALDSIAERARAFAQDWGSRIVVLSGAGHINGDSGLGDWPEGLKLFGALRRRASWRIPTPAKRISPVPVCGVS